MSGNYENLPFKRGATYGAADNTVAINYEGKEYVHQDTTYGTGCFVRVRVCRNNSGGVLAPSRAAKFNQTAGKPLSDIAGYCTVAAEKSGIIDEFLPPTGVPAGDLFYIVVSGPTLAYTDLAAISTNIAVGDMLHTIVAASTGATTAGRVGEASFAGATNVLGGQLQNVVGRAMSAATTAQTNSLLLVQAGFGNWQ